MVRPRVVHWGLASVLVTLLVAIAALQLGPVAPWPTAAATHGAGCLGGVRRPPPDLPYELAWCDFVSISLVAARCCLAARGCPGSTLSGTAPYAERRLSLLIQRSSNSLCVVLSSSSGWLLSRYLSADTWPPSRSI